MSIESLVQEFTAVAASPRAQLKKYKDAGYKCIGVMPYYAPEELVHAAGMVPLGMWGSNKKTISKAKEYCATFYCTIAQLDVEMLLDGTCDLLDGVITTALCDTLRPMTQNIRVMMEGKLPTIFLAHPQFRRPAFGLEFCRAQYTHVKTELEKIRGSEITDEEIRNSIKVYNKSRAARREFVKLASEHCDVIDPIMRSAVLKSAWFMRKEEHTEKLEALNAELKALPAAKWNGVKIVTSGIVVDSPALLKVLKDNHVAIAADDVAHESRPIRVDASEEGDPMMALCQQFGTAAASSWRSWWRTPARRAWSCSCNSSATPRRWSTRISRKRWTPTRSRSSSSASTSRCATSVRRRPLSRRLSTCSQCSKPPFCGLIKL